MKNVKNRIKKIVLLMTASIVFIAMSGTSVSAAELSPSLQEMKDYLLSIGTEQEFLNDISENRIETLYWMCVGKEVTFLKYETEIVEIQEANPNLRGQISTSKLKLGIGVYEFTSDGYITGLNVSTYYEWLSNPILHWTDAHTFTFDGTKFKIGGMYAESGYDISGQWLSVDYIDTPATAADGGLGWFLSIAKGDLSNSLTNRGGADIYLIPRSENSSKTQLSSSMYYTYAHQIAGTSISLSTSGGSVSISGGSYDYQTKIYNY